MNHTALLGWAASMGAIFLLACAAMEIPSTSDPYKKLGHVEFLLQTNRPIPAERILNEAIAKFEANGDKHGLAMAYDEYGVFLRHPSVSTRAQAYSNSGFIDKSVSFENRLAKSVEYFEKARSIGIELDSPEFLCHVYYNLGIGYLLIKQDGRACDAYNESYRYNRINISRNPGAQPQVPKGYNNFEEYIMYCKKKAGCPS